MKEQPEANSLSWGELIKSSAVTQCPLFSGLTAFAEVKVNEEKLIKDTASSKLNIFIFESFHHIFTKRLNAINKY